MRILVDLHGGDPEDPTAIAEFKEIKDRVIEEVNIHLLDESNCVDAL